MEKELTHLVSRLQLDIDAMPWDDKMPPQQFHTSVNYFIKAFLIDAHKLIKEHDAEKELD